MDRQGREFAQLLHHRVAFLAMAHGFVSIRRIRRKIRVVRRHNGQPRIFESVAVTLPRQGVRLCDLFHLTCGRNRPDRRELFFLLAKQLAAGSIDEMKPAASLADHGFVAAVRIVRIRFVQPMLHVQTGQGTFEDEITHARRTM